MSTAHCSLFPLVKRFHSGNNDALPIPIRSWIIHEYTQHRRSSLVTIIVSDTQAYYLYRLASTVISFLSCSLFSELSQLFLSPTFFSSNSFFLSHGVPFPLSTSPASESLCPYAMIVDLSLAKLLLSFSYFRPPFWNWPLP